MKRKFQGGAYGVTAALVLLAGAGEALAESAGRTTPDVFDGAYLLQVFGSLLLVFACFFALVFLSKKFNGIPTGSRKAIQVLSSAKLGSKEKVVLLRVGGQYLLLGVATGSVRKLHHFDGSEEGFSEENLSAEALGTIMFSGVSR